MTVEPTATRVFSSSNKSARTGTLVTSVNRLFFTCTVIRDIPVIFSKDSLTARTEATASLLFTCSKGSVAVTEKRTRAGVVVPNRVFGICSAVLRPDRTTDVPVNVPIFILYTSNTSALYSIIRGAASSLLFSRRATKSYTPVSYSTTRSHTILSGELSTHTTEHPPPQSTPVSVPFCFPSKQVGARNIKGSAIMVPTPAKNASTVRVTVVFLCLLHDIHCSITYEKSTLFTECCLLLYKQYFNTLSWRQPTFAPKDYHWFIDA